MNMVDKVVNKKFTATLIWKKLIYVDYIIRIIYVDYLHTIAFFLSFYRISEVC